MVNGGGVVDTTAAERERSSSVDWPDRGTAKSAGGTQSQRVNKPSKRIPLSYLKHADLNTSKTASLLWEGRLRKVLVGLGVVSNLANRSEPIKAMGLELAYFTSEADT